MDCHFRLSSFRRPNTYFVGWFGNPKQSNFDLFMLTFHMTCTYCHITIASPFFHVFSGEIRTYRYSFTIDFEHFRCDVFLGVFVLFSSFLSVGSALLGWCTSHVRTLLEKAVRKSYRSEIAHKIFMRGW